MTGRRLLAATSSPSHHIPRAASRHRPEPTKGQHDGNDRRVRLLEIAVSRVSREPARRGALSTQYFPIVRCV